MQVIDESVFLGPAKIAGFTPKLSVKQLKRVGNDWYASDEEIIIRIPEEIDETELFTEGASKTISVNIFERNPIARSKCLAHHGYKCIVCSFDFEEFYGSIG